MSGFSDTQVVGFGVFGQQTAATMDKALREQSLALSYNPDTRRFTVSSDRPHNEEYSGPKRQDQKSHNLN